MQIRASDDLGLGTLKLKLDQLTPVEDVLRTTQHEEMLRERASGPQAVVDAETLWESDTLCALATYEIAAGDSLQIRAAATDTSVLGIQSGESRTLSFQVVTPDELFYEILMRQRALRGRFAAATETIEQQQEMLAALVAAKEASGLLRTTRVVRLQVEQIANQLEAVREELELNQLGTPQSHELLSTTIISPLRQLHAEPLARLRQAYETLGMQQPIREASREAASTAQADTLAEMQRILSRMSQWESFVDVINQLKGVIQLQEGTLNSTQQAHEEQTGELFDE